MQTRLHGSLRNLEQRRDLGFGQPVHVAEHEHRAVFWCELGKHRAYVEHVREIDVGRGPVDDLSGEVAGARLTNRLPHRDAAHPTVQRRGLSERAQVAQHRDEGLLHRVVSSLECDRSADAPDVRGEGAHERVHRRWIPPLRGANELVHTRRRRVPTERFQRLWNLGHRGAPLLGMTHNRTQDKTQVNVVGGGLAGMIAAITASEHGAGVDLHEAHDRLGGRAHTLGGQWRANWGPHALYCDGPLWAWLAERDLIPPVARPALTGMRFRCDGEAMRTPPLSMVRSLAILRARAVPDDVSFREWAGARFGEEAARRWASAIGVATFCHDPGALAASFVTDRLRRAYAVPSAARFPIGGWSALTERLEARLHAIGVRIHANSVVEHLPPAPVIVALAPPAARRLLDDDSIDWPGARTVLLDVGMRSRRGDASIVSDLDESGFAERFSCRDASLAPAGHSLVQAQIGARPGETLGGGVARAEALLDIGFPLWREREVWRRRAVVECQSGALDPPGSTWADRPAIDRGEGVWLAGDFVAAPGLLAEVSWASAVTAATAAALWVLAHTT